MASDRNDNKLYTELDRILDELAEGNDYEGDSLEYQQDEEEHEEDEPVDTESLTAKGNAARAQRYFARRNEKHEEQKYKDAAVLQSELMDIFDNEVSIPSPIDSDALSPPLMDINELKRSWEHRSVKDQHNEGVDQFLKAQVRKRHVDVSTRLKHLETLKQDFPNFAEVIDFLHGQMAISVRTKQPLNIVPLNLHGEPGIGKTVFVEALAKSMALEFFDLHISGMNTEFELVGGHSTYTKATAGAFATTLILRAKTYHPVILLDEICLLSRNNKVDMYHPLYGVLDKEQARRFRDNYLDAQIDASHAIYISTTNNIENLPPAIRSRIKSFTIEPPTAEQTKEMLPQIFKSVLVELKLIDIVSLEVPELAIENLALLSPRRIKLELKDALGRAVARQVNSESVSLSVQDFDIVEHNDTEHNSCDVTYH